MTMPAQQAISLTRDLPYHLPLVNIPKPSTPRIPPSTLPSHRFLLRPLELLILPLMHKPQHQRQTNYRQANRGIRAAARDVPRSIAGRVHVRAVDRSGVCDAVSDGDGAGAFDERPREGVGDPGDDDLVGGYGAHWHLLGND